MQHALRSVAIQRAMDLLWNDTEPYGHWMAPILCFSEGQGPGNHFVAVLWWELFAQHLVNVGMASSSDADAVSAWAHRTVRACKGEQFWTGKPGCLAEFDRRKTMWGDMCNELANVPELTALVHARYASIDSLRDRLGADRKVHVLFLLQSLWAHFRAQAEGKVDPTALCQSLSASCLAGKLDEFFEAGIFVVCSLKHILDAPEETAKGLTRQNASKNPGT